MAIAEKTVIIDIPDEISITFNGTNTYTKTVWFDPGKLPEGATFLRHNFKCIVTSPGTIKKGEAYVKIGATGKMVCSKTYSGDTEIIDGLRMFTGITSQIPIDYYGTDKGAAVTVTVHDMKYEYTYQYEEGGQEESNGLFVKENSIITEISEVYKKVNGVPILVEDLETIFDEDTKYVFI